ncbi:MAG: Peptidoglycan/LPS O-acetylase OafA/YrhL, contains acyltransferase and SGNH-hydrolase domain [Sphingobacteriales bacterium]|nr:Peptidoglycan/LPS O-acetylase OafA/YrhL, contains acyltransferase and SGNH-hydrolase domain [Sphingobacteriales bacterium]
MYLQSTHTSQKIKYIDSLRGIAILMVIFCHSHPYIAELYNVVLPPFFEIIVTNGDKGVTLFFLMSAFTLCLSFNYKTETERDPVRNYFIRRIFRIVPLYYFILLLTLLLNVNSPSISSIIANFLFLHGLSPYWVNSTFPGGWSVGIEVLFYLVFPVLFYKIKSLTNLINLILFCLIISKLVLSFMTKNNPIEDGALWKVFVYENFISQLPVFLIGMCLFKIQYKKEIFDKDLTMYKSLLFTAAIILIHLLGGNIFKSHYLFAIAFAIAAYGLSKWQPQVIVNNLTIWIGKLSYSIYLIHLLIAKLLVKYHLIYSSSDVILDVFIRFFILLSTSTILAWLTNRLIELPFQALGKRLIDKWENNQMLVIKEYNVKQINL